MSVPTRSQLEVTRAVVRWYFETHYGSRSDFGLLQTFSDPRQVGVFAVSKEDYERGDGPALFRMLVACAMFQRLRDQLVLKILREMPPKVAAEVSDPDTLRKLIGSTACDALRSTQSLREDCDLTKQENVGCCSHNPTARCHLKVHTVALKRYGHFGKMPSSLLLALNEHNAGHVYELFSRVISQHQDQLARAKALEAALSTAWRVSEKISSMFLSLVTNPDTSGGYRPPFADDVDWTHFVVVDSNVDLFLRSIGYNGLSTYEARRAFIKDLGRRIDLREFADNVHAFNPRLVQQAMYLFMSKSNRQAASSDCMTSLPSRCGECPRSLVKRCPVSPASQR